MINKNKNNNDRKFYEGNAFLIGLIAISIIFIFFVIFMVWNPFKIRSYKGMKDIEVKEVFTIGTKKEIENYYIYFYKSQSACTPCNESEPFIAEYAEMVRANKDSGLKPIYVIDLLVPENARYIAEVGESANLKDVTNYRDLKVAYTPTLIEISKGKVIKAWDSKTAVLKELENQKKKVETTSLASYLPASFAFGRKDNAFN